MRKGLGTTGKFETGHRKRPIRRLQVVIPVFNEAENVDPLVRELADKLSRFDLSILFVDDGSTDGTLVALQTLRQAGLPVDYISLSRNFGKEAALMAGFMLSPDGFDALATMDGDGQHPPEAIAEMVSAAERADAELVIGIRDHGNDHLNPSQQIRRAFYALFNAFSQTKLPHGIGDFNLYRPAAAEAIRSLNEYDLFLKGLVAWIGFDPIFVKHEVRVRTTPGTRWTLRKLLKLTANGLLSFTDWPLRVWSLIGAVLALVSFTYLAVTLVQALVFGSDVKGYPSMIMTILGLGGLQLLSVGILGAYIGRMYMEGKQRPRYIVRESSLHASLASHDMSRSPAVQ
jgi:glycosyltransferase involved in cell wall biosynthesis